MHIHVCVDHIHVCVCVDHIHVCVEHVCVDNIHVEVKNSTDWYYIIKHEALHVYNLYYKPYVALNIALTYLSTYIM